jgi:hypothetical protein
VRVSSNNKTRVSNNNNKKSKPTSKNKEINQGGERERERETFEGRRDLGFLPSRRAK